MLRPERGIGVLSERREEKKRAKMKFLYCTDNIIFLRDKRATVPV